MKTTTLLLLFASIILSLNSCTPLPTGGYATPPCPNNFILNLTTQVANPKHRPQGKV